MLLHQLPMISPAETLLIPHSLVGWMLHHPPLGIAKWTLTLPRIVTVPHLAESTTALLHYCSHRPSMATMIICSVPTLEATKMLSLIIVSNLFPAGPGDIIYFLCLLVVSCISSLNSYALNYLHTLSYRNSNWGEMLYTLAY